MVWITNDRYSDDFYHLLLMFSLEYRIKLFGIQISLVLRCSIFISPLYLDSSSLALGNSIGDGGPWWVYHSHDPDHSESRQREIDLVGVEGESWREFPDRKSGVAECHETLAKASEFCACVPTIKQT